jgi:teichuronic acid biosynthesis glycosyltransferase TuaH
VLLVAGSRLSGTTALGDLQLARALARRRPLLYIEPPLSLTGLRDGGAAVRSAVADARAHVDASGVRAIRPVVTPAPDRPAGAGLADLLYRRQVIRAARDLPPRRVLLTFDVRRGLLPAVPRDLTVFWRRDRSDADPGLRHPGQFRERQSALLASADLVCAVTPELVDGLARPDRPAEVIANGCDVTHFTTPQPLPPELAALPRPLIGFAGGVSWRLDVDLVAELARARPDWSIVLVGEQTRPVPEVANLHVLGRKNYADLPGYVQGFDVGLVPYVEDDFNRAAFPLKVFEYLAAGVPVVGTPLPALTGLATPTVVAARGVAETVAAVQAMLSDGPGAAACREVAQGNSWDARAERFEGLVEQRLLSVRRP